MKHKVQAVAAAFLVGSQDVGCVHTSAVCGCLLWLHKVSGRPNILCTDLPMSLNMNVTVMKRNKRAGPDDQT